MEFLEVWLMNSNRNNLETTLHAKLKIQRKSWFLSYCCLEHFIAKISRAGFMTMWPMQCWETGIQKGLAFRIETHNDWHLEILNNLVFEFVSEFWCHSGTFPGELELWLINVLSPTSSPPSWDRLLCCLLSDSWSPRSQAGFPFLPLPCDLTLSTQGVNLITRMEGSMFFYCNATASLWFGQMDLASGTHPVFSWARQDGSHPWTYWQCSCTFSRCLSMALILP